jgi:2-polyprenyl-3-methyl-5-hydroxy-6-metoxy-1,4-benzoquinol methylase
VFAFRCQEKRGQFPDSDEMKRVNLREIQRNWDRLGQTDPLWAVLGLPDRKGGRWKPDEFFATGAAEIQSLMHWIDGLGVSISHLKALDFGCGVGRLTQALAPYFDEVYGVDIAPSMIELARSSNRQGGKCKYYLNCTDDLRIFATGEFDLIYSNITLQHINPRYYGSYISEFLRILSSTGLLIFQIPDVFPTLRSKMIRFGMDNTPTLLNVIRRIRLRGKPIMELYGTPPERIIRMLHAREALIVKVEPVPLGTPDTYGIKKMWRYCVKKS